MRSELAEEAQQAKEKKQKAMRKINKKYTIESAQITKWSMHSNKKSYR